MMTPSEVDQMPQMRTIGYDSTAVTMPMSVAASSSALNALNQRTVPGSARDQRACAVCADQQCLFGHSFAMCVYKKWTYKPLIFRSYSCPEQSHAQWGLKSSRDVLMKRRWDVFISFRHHRSHCMRVVDFCSLLTENGNNTDRPTSTAMTAALGRTMRAAVVRKFGAPEHILIEQGFPRPSPAAGQVLVRVHASGVNPVDTYIRSGQYANLPALPYVPGREGAGIVEEVGEGVSKLKAGDRVWFTQPITGSAADYTVTEHAYELPEELSFSQGASLGIAYMTAYRALFLKAKAEKGQSVFIHGASGGVGLAACQLAASHGLKVVGSVGTDAGKELALANGAEFVANHRQPDYVQVLMQRYPEGFDIVLEMLANVNLTHDASLIAKYGKICVIGSRGEIQINPRALMQKESSIIGVMLFHNTPEDYDNMGNEISRLIKEGHVRPVVGKEFPLEELAAAHNEVINQTGSLGKIVVNID
uniref:PKS_ER domain-containing protein n=1 Tax=Steinernema glaseri TaxID=37863 RepID=A0A1I8A9X8_9BILA